MRAIYLIIAVVMLFMFVFVANEIDLGVASPLLSVGFVGVFIYCLFLFAADWRESRRRPNEQAEFKKRLDNIMSKSRKARETHGTSRRGSKREY